MNNSMDTVMGEILQISLVKGYTLYTLRQEMLCSRFLAEQTSEFTDKADKALANIIKMGTSSGMPISNVECHFKTDVGITFHLKNGRLLTVSCRLGANKRLIRTIFNTLRDEIEQILAVEPVTENPKIQTPIKSLSSKTSTSNRQIDSGGVVIKRQLRPRVDIIRKSLEDVLSDSVGLSLDAENIMNEGLREWVSLGAVNKKTLPILAEILCRQIPGRKSQQLFMDEVEDTFLGYKK